MGGGIAMACAEAGMKAGVPPVHKNLPSGKLMDNTDLWEIYSGFMVIYGD